MLARRARLAISQLGESDKALLLEYFFLDRTLDDLAAARGLSRSWMSRSVDRALANLRELIDPPRKRD